MSDESAKSESINPTLYAGAGWLRHALEQRGKELCPFGERVANLLGWVFAGIYHIDDSVLSKGAVWDHDAYVRITLGRKDLSTYDSNILTRLVIACHDLAIRMEINPCNGHYIELLFHPRLREGGVSRRHPTIEEAIERARAER